MSPVDTTSSSNSLKISTNTMYCILDRLKMNKDRASTRRNYYNIWKLFNNFVIKLDFQPSESEDRIFLFLAHLINQGQKSCTVKSFYSGIKAVLQDINVEIQDNTILLSAITKACKTSYDVITPRYPIKIDLLEILLLEISSMYDTQPFLKSLYLALFSLA